jgi:ABC-2 type transport system ATP-binding protein
MEEVEEICDNVMIMSRGSVSFHGSIAELRSMAPDPGHVLRTSDDARARTIARNHPRLSVVPVEEGLRVVGPEPAAAAYVADIVHAGLGLRAFIPTETPLEALFFMLTDDVAHGAPRPVLEEVGSR